MLIGSDGIQKSGRHAAGISGRHVSEQVGDMNRNGRAAWVGIYRQIELFFKWIKQNLKIKSFLGTSKNAVMTQIWVAMSYYLLLTYIKYQTKYAHSLLTLSRLIRETLFERKNLIDILTLKPERLSCSR